MLKSSITYFKNLTYIERDSEIANAISLYSYSVYYLQFGMEYLTFSIVSEF